jgi:hypothetical protein
VLGDRPVEMSVMCRGDTESADQRSTLGSPSFGDLLVARDGQVASAGADSVRRNAANAVLDSDVSFGFKRDGVWDGQAAPPMIRLSVSNQVAEQAGASVVTDLLRRVHEVVDGYSPICGLVDLARPADAYAGMVYGTAWPQNAPLARWVEQTRWLYSAAKKQDRLRGLYWGNYLGPKILKRLGGPDAFSSAFRQHARSHDGSGNAHQWHFPNGMFVSLCLDPLDCRPDRPAGLHPAAERNMKWLVRELGAKGVLDQW